MRVEEVNMRVTKISEARKESLSDPLFTGPDVTRQVLLPDSQEFNVNVVNFGRGFATNFILTTASQSW